MTRCSSRRNLRHGHRAKMIANRSAPCPLLVPDPFVVPERARLQIGAV